MTNSHLVIAAFFFGSALLSLCLTLGVERQSGWLGLVQPPNERSSHTRPTPRGGGIGAAITGVLVCVLLSIIGDQRFAFLAILSASIALLGFVDDLLNLKPGIRFCVQAVLVSVLLLTTPSLPTVQLPGGLILGGLALWLLCLTVGLWWINLYNFMDGIDGIAASQAILILVGVGLVWQFHGSFDLDANLLVLIIAAVGAAAGFLVRNWPPAKIFMGDAGSNFLAFTILAIAISTLTLGVVGYPAWVILTSVFVIDATVTLIRRLLNGERPWRAHRRHAYQQLSRRWGHRRVTLVYCAISVVWSIPMALLASHLKQAEWWIVLAETLPLVGLALWAKAGAPSEQ